ncbi:MAG: cupin domain-containing protein [Acidimicrobiaceae bacterium]|jgi:gentisate 1,2-dioxygenase|nr:cupin domain-containing protein [Acidimicrobiaceae bacterium]MBT5579444.1 cupin domain-containing protein [Acidimicrobiaceae bacterium]MBT5848943.1 cupin domain-containing protein [Acidimicrobiaceae bacterium]
MSDDLQRNSTTPTEFVPVDPAASELQDHHSYFDGAIPGAIRPAHWPMKEIRTQLEAMAEDPQWDGNTRYLSLKSTDGPNNSSIPTMWVTVHLLKPGERIDMHRHTPGSMYYIISGSGYSTINEYRIEWEDGDSFSCPSYSYHEHWNSGDRNVLMYTVQDAPTYAYNRMMAFQAGDSESMDSLHT